MKTLGKVFLLILAMLFGFFVGGTMYKIWGPPCTSSYGFLVCSGPLEFGIKSAAVIGIIGFFLFVVDFFTSNDKNITEKSV